MRALGLHVATSLLCCSGYSYSVLTLFMFLMKSVPTVQGEHLVSSFIQVNPTTKSFWYTFFFFLEVSSIHRSPAAIHVFGKAERAGALPVSCYILPLIMPQCIILNNVRYMAKNKTTTGDHLKVSNYNVIPLCNMIK